MIIEDRKVESAPHVNRPIATAGVRRTLFFLLQFTWGLPVNLVGLLVFLCCKGCVRKVFNNSLVSLLPDSRGGLSLGIFIFIGAKNTGAALLCAHEYGHTIQCLFLGPLYWPVVAIPSAVWYHFFGGYRKRRNIPYDALYCERWATAWGKKWSGKQGY